jgi:hypothetical protein
MPSIAATDVAGGSEISRRLGGAHFHDCYAVAIAPTAQTALELYLGAVAQTPAWVNRLMALRNRVVRLFGLKNLGHLNALNASNSVGDYRLGDRIGIFSLLYLSDDEVILGDSDKHLNVQVSVCKVGQGERCVLHVATVVHIHNTMGRIYMMLVKPVHQLIVPAVLRRAPIGVT